MQSLALGVLAGGKEGGIGKREALRLWGVRAYFCEGMLRFLEPEQFRNGFDQNSQFGNLMQAPGGKPPQNPKALTTKAPKPRALTLNPKP